MGKHLKQAYKTCKIVSLPKSYQLKIKQVLNQKTDDLPVRVRISTYIFTVWTSDLSVEYSRY